MTNISNEAELRACKDDATADYTVTADIVLTGAFTSYQIYAYTGTFDGGDYTISNLTIAYNTIYSGLFRYNNTGTIQNVKLSNVACSCTDAGFGTKV